jgi:drug/metabolite transporter (DMT)-like permease
MPAQVQPQNSLWLVYALATVVAWGLYGVLLHLGQLGMDDPANGRIKAFLCVGIAYVLVAVLAPLALLVTAKATWVYPSKGFMLSILAGVAGAIGALCVLLAFGAKGNPAVVMSIVFAGAPVVNAIGALLVHPPAGGWSSVKWQFVAGILCAAVGGLLVMRYRPLPAATSTPPSAESTAR